MLYLGALDDKTIEYPFVPIEGQNGFSDSYMIYQCLFNKHVIMEEGFLLASKEAMHGGETGTVLLEAARAGLVKIASRYSNLDEYIAERKGVGHPVPPDTEQCRAYLLELEKACHLSSAFCEYGPPSLDKLTFDQFVTILIGPLRELINDAVLPETFVEMFGEYYAHGNKGQQWTARSALEKTAKKLLPHRPDLISAVMVAANRERQILRGAAIAHFNRLGEDVYVETGYTSIPSSLAIEEVVAKKAVETLYTNPTEYFPRVSFSDLRANYKKLFHAFGADQHEGEKRRSYLRRTRDDFLELKDMYMTDGSDSVLADVKSAAADYEEEILKAIGRPKFEDTLVGISSGVAGSYLATKGIDMISCSILKNIKHEAGKRISGSQPWFRHDSTRRQFCLAGIVGVTGAALTGNYLAGNAGAELAINIVQHRITDDFQDNPIKYMNNKDIILNPKCAHHRLKVDEKSAAQFFSKPPS